MSWGAVSMTKLSCAAASCADSVNCLVCLLMPGSGVLQLALLIPCLVFLALRGTTGALAIYPSKERFWVEDYLYYSMDTLPELLTAAILCWPTLMARIGQSYPRATNPEKVKKLAKGELSPADMTDDLTASSNDHNDPPDSLHQQDQVAMDKQV